MTMPMIAAPMTVNKTIPELTSLAIFASWRHSWVTRSVTDSILVFIISARKTKNIVQTTITNSILPIRRKMERIIVPMAKVSMTKKLGWVRKAYQRPLTANLKEMW